MKGQNKMKKLTAVILSLILALSLFSVTAFAADSSANVYVTISSKGNTLDMAYVSVSVTDIDGDGALTINDALYCAHEKAYKGGAAEGYKSSVTVWGLSLMKLWGVENGGSFGYYVNNSSAWSLRDKVNEGDHVYAFVYSDTEDLSDSYSFFTETTATADQGQAITVSLKKLSYNALWILEESPVEGAVITVDGKATKVKTDAEGNATVTLTKKGRHIVSAQSPEGEIITPPVCEVTVNSNISSLISYYFRLIISSILSIFGK